MSHVMLSCVLVVCGSEATAPKQPTAEELERGAMEYRRSLTSGRVVVTQVQQDLGRRPSDKWKKRYTMEFQGDRLRVDVVWEDRDNPENRTFEQAALIGAEYIFDSYIEISPVEIGMKADKLRYTRAAVHLIQPRLLGVACVPIVILHSKTLESLLARTDREPPAVSRDRVDGHDAWRVDYTFMRGAKSKMWIVPEMGYAVLRHEIVRGTTYATIHSKYKQYEGVWYPREVVYELRFNRQVVEHETVTVESAEFGTKIDEARFTLATFGLKPGDEVRAYGDHRTWDGQKLLAGLQPIPAPAVDLTQDSAGNRWRTLLWVNAIVLSLSAAWMLARYLRNQSRKNP